MTVSKTNKNKKKISSKNLSNSEIVAKCLNPSNKLSYMKIHLVKLVETLEDKFLRECVCLLAINLLKYRSKLERIMKVIWNFAVNKNTIPRPLRSKVILETALPPVKGYQRFMAIKEEAKQFHELWLKNYKKYFRELKSSIERTLPFNSMLYFLNFFWNFQMLKLVKRLLWLPTISKKYSIIQTRDSKPSCGRWSLMNMKGLEPKITKYN